MTKREKKLREKIIQGLELSHKRLIKSKKENNLNLIVSDYSGKIIIIPAKNL